MARARPSPMPEVAPIMRTVCLTDISKSFR
jgi:hypothetical protein